MYASYVYSPGAIYNQHINPHLTSGRNLYSDHEEKVQKSLSKYITEDGNINGTALQKNWFPAKNVDVFLSHSHKDLNKAKAFAGWLKDNFGLTSFIDSCCWGYCDNLLKKIDDKYCYNKNKNTYDYDLRNYTTSHVHMMLATALTEVMEKSECIIFFNTPESIIMSDELKYIKNNENNETTSPWILYELSMMTSIKRSLPQRMNGDYLTHEQREALTIKYDISKQLRTLFQLNDKHLLDMANKYKNEQTHPLDILYSITKVTKI